MSNRSSLSLALVLLVASLFLASCGGNEAAPPPGSQPGDRADISALTPDDLLAVLDPEAVASTFLQPETWWPTLPEINVGFEPVSEPVAGDRFFVTQSYQEVGALSHGRIETTLILFEDTAAAQTGFAKIAALDAEGGEITTGPVAGDEVRYVLRQATAEEQAQGALPYESLLRFRVGPLVGRVSVFTELGFTQADALAEYFAPIERRANALLAGDLEASPLPAAITDLLPEAEAPVGPVHGSAVRPAESWALVDTAGDPLAVLDRLHKLGATQLGLRRYGLQSEPDLVVEATVFQMRDAAAAKDWVTTFVESTNEAGPLDPGATGDVAAYTSYGGEFYELQFAAGPVVGDVVCFAPFGVTTAACEAPVRAFAERWYQELTAR